jgi:hypothetical protein
LTGVTGVTDRALSRPCHLRYRGGMRLSGTREGARALLGWLLAGAVGLVLYLCGWALIMAWLWLLWSAL